MAGKLVQIGKRLLYYWRREQFDRELEEEMRFHLEMKVQENIRAGMTPREARYTARRQFGNLTLLQEVSRDMWGFQFIETLFQDLRFSLRTLVKNPGFTAVAVLSLALGIGANTAIYSIVHAVFLHPLAVERPEELVVVSTNSVSYPAYVELREQNQVFDGLAAFTGRELSLDQGSRPERISGQVVSGNYFDVLGVKAILGRTFLPDEDQTPGTHPVVVLSHHLWQERFGGDREVIGKTLRLNGETFTVIGVAPPAFRGTSLASMPDLWVPMMMWPRLATGYFTKLDLNTRSWNWLRAFGRLRPGVAVEGAEAEVNRLALQNLEANRQKMPPDYHLELQPITVAATGIASRQDFVRFVALLMAVVGIALLMACANVANLLLARAGARRKEISLRLALGASRTRLIRQLLTESVLLALLAGGASLLVALWAMNLLSSFSLPGNIAIGKLGLGLKPGMLAFTFLLSLLTGIAFGIVPAFSASKPDLIASLKDHSSSSMPHRARLRQVLVAAQVALCLLLLIGAGLFIRSLRNALHINIGFEPEQVAAASVNLGLQRYDEVRALAFYEHLSERLVGLPGVQSAGWVSEMPLGGGRWVEGVDIEGFQPADGKNYSDVDTNAVSPGYFQTLGIPLVQGRDFTLQDKATAPGVVIVNEALVRTYWPGQNPLGKRLRMSNHDFLVVGVVKDHKFVDLRSDPEPQFFFSLAQQMDGQGLATINLVARTDGNPASLLGVIEQEAHQLDSSLPVIQLRTLDETLKDQLVAQRFGSTLLALFSGLALALAIVGIYGVVAYAVAQRRREMGIRIALGAQPHNILRLILGRGSIPIAIGIGLGLGAAVVLTRVLTGFLYDLNTADPITFCGAALLLAAIALFASYLPARRATRVDPMAALRQE